MCAAVISCGQITVFGAFRPSRLKAAIASMIGAWSVPKLQKM